MKATLSDIRVIASIIWNVDRSGLLRFLDSAALHCNRTSAASPEGCPEISRWCQPPVT